MTTDFVVVPGMTATITAVPPHPAHPGKTSVLSAHRAAFGPFPTREAAAAAAVASGLDPDIHVIPRRTA